MAKRLRVWVRGADDNETVVAYGQMDAWAVRQEHTGEPRETWAVSDRWRPVPANQKITIHVNRDGKPSYPDADDYAGLATRTASEWIRLMGRGYLCTKEW